MCTLLLSVSFSCGYSPAQNEHSLIDASSPLDWVILWCGEMEYHLCQLLWFSLVIMLSSPNFDASSDPLSSYSSNSADSSSVSGNPSLSPLSLSLYNIYLVMVPGVAEIIYVFPFSSIYLKNSSFYILIVALLDSLLLIHICWWMYWDFVGFRRPCADYRDIVCGFALRKFEVDERSLEFMPLLINVTVNLELGDCLILIDSFLFGFFWNWCLLGISHVICSRSSIPWIVENSV